MIYVVWLYCGTDLDIRSEEIFIAAVHESQEAAVLAMMTLQQQLEKASQVRSTWAQLPNFEARRDAHNAMALDMQRIAQEMRVADERWKVSGELIEYGGFAYCVPMPLTAGGKA
jgi:hypothetical protein